MKHSLFLRRALASALALLCALPLPAAALFRSRQTEGPYVADFSKNGLIGSIIAFSPEDFVVQTENRATLNSITLDTLPDPGAGTLAMGGRPLTAGTQVDRSALGGLRFQSAPAPTVTETSFTFTPSFSSGQETRATTVTLHLLTKENRPPVARSMELSTYRNVALTGYFDAADDEGDPLTFQLTSTPARGAVTMAEDGSSRFVYTPYENKTGRDSFTYVAADPAGNCSAEARVTVRIDRPDTRVTYADLEGHSAHRAAIHLAEEGVYVGQYAGGRYFFQPEAPVSRAQFLTLAMDAAGLEPMTGVARTGFTDDASIPAWAKGAVSAALSAGAIQGYPDQTGAPVFGADETITRAQAAVMLNRLLAVEDVPAEVFFAPGQTHWAAQAAANLAASGVLSEQALGPDSLSAALTRGEAAELLDGALELLDARRTARLSLWSQS